MIDTKDKILETAERLIGEQGYAATSLRQIIAEAGVNLAAVHYHFGSKEELLDELVQRKAEKVNAIRMSRLQALEHAGGKPGVRVILDAFFEPALEMASSHPQFVRLMGRVISEGMMPEIAERHFYPTVQRFIRALQQALPGIPPAEVAMRGHFMLGALAHTMSSSPKTKKVAARDTELRRRMKMLVTFLAAGFSAPASKAEEA